MAFMPLEPKVAVGGIEGDSAGVFHNDNGTLANQFGGGYPLKDVTDRGAGVRGVNNDEVIFAIEEGDGLGYLAAINIGPICQTSPLKVFPDQGTTPWVLLHEVSPLSPTAQRFNAHGTTPCIEISDS